MDGARSPRRGLFSTAAVVLILAAAALWLPRWWESREFWQAQAIAGVGSRVLPGTVTEARKKIDPGLAAERITAAIGKPSFSVGTTGKDSRREIWTYYYADGTMTVNLTDGAAQRISTVYGPPRVPKSTRPQ